MIPLGGPPLCAVCRTLMHEPTPACPTPFVCLSGPAHDCAPTRWHRDDGTPVLTFDEIATRGQIPQV